MSLDANGRDNENFVYLSFVREGDKFKVIDQDGRRVHGLRSATARHSMDSVCTIDIECCDAPLETSNGTKHT